MADGKALERKVTVGLLDEKRAQILEGVKDGEAVITSGATMLHSGDRVVQQK